LRRAESDFSAVETALHSGTALDVACFHAQQGAEKYLKAYLITRGVDFPFTHNLARLLVLCREHDSAFAALLPLGDALTPDAVELRHDATFWPSLEEAKQARDAALTIKSFVLERLPPDLHP
jgi:HEPN domain-containing protein